MARRLLFPGRARARRSLSSTATATTSPPYYTTRRSRTSPKLLEAVTAAAGIALENGRLHAELRARLEELRGSRARIVAAAQKERQRLERNLHDGAQQRLVALSLELSLIEEKLEGDPTHGLNSIGEARDRRHSGRASRSRERNPSRCRQRTRPRSGAGAARRTCAGTCPADGRRRRTLPEPIEVAGLLRRLGESRQRRQVRKGVNGDGRRCRSERLLVVEVADDGIGGADTERGTGCGASRTASKRSAAVCGSGARPVAVPASRAEIPCA